MTLAIVTLTAVRDGDQITLIDRQGERISTVSADRLMGVHQPEGECDSYRKSVDYWRKWLCTKLANLPVGKSKTWAEHLSNMAKANNKREYKRAKAKITKKARKERDRTWKQATLQMHINHLKVLDLHRNPCSAVNWKEWALNTSTNSRRRMREKDMARSRRKRSTDC